MSAPCVAGEGIPGLPSGNSLEAEVKRLAAEVGKGKITVDRVMEVWGPVWYDSVDRARSGKITPEECDKELQAQWDDALETVIRSEIFFQESDREFEQMITKQIEATYEARVGRPVYNKETHAYRRIELEVRDRINKVIDRQFNSYVDANIRAAGGLEQLKKVIVDRGISWTEWRDRLRRKAFADMYLHSKLEPVGSGIRDLYKPSPSEIRKYFHEHPEEFKKPGKVVFRHIYFSFDKRGGEDAARAASANVYDAISEKRFTFADAARRFSDDEVGKSKDGLEDGISGDPVRDAWLQEVRDGARRLEPGELGPILISPNGCHLVMLVEKYPGEPISFRDAQNSISDRLYAKRWGEKVDKLYESLKEKVRIVIRTPKFPQEYSWKRFSETAGRMPRPVRRIGASAASPETGVKEPAE